MIQIIKDRLDDFYYFMNSRGESANLLLKTLEEKGMLPPISTVEKPMYFEGTQDAEFVPITTNQWEPEND